MFAGLMHNIGFILLNGSQQGSLNKDSNTVDDYAKMDLDDYELKHQEIGGYLLDMWDIPFPMYEVAMFHHRPTNPSIVHHELVSCVHIAQHYAWVCLGATMSEAVSKEVFDRIDIDVDDFEKRLSRYLKSDHDKIRSKVSI